MQVRPEAAADALPLARGGGPRGRHPPLVPRRRPHRLGAARRAAAHRQAAAPRRSDDRGVA